MVDTVRIVNYFSTRVPNQPGEAFKVLSALVSSGINLLACNGTSRGEYAQIDVVPDDNREFNAAVTKAGLSFDPTRTGFLIQGEDRQGALTEHLKKLAEGRVNVTGIDALTAGAGRWGAIIWVNPEDVDAAAKLLGVR
jgi:hypothetical protein